MTYTERTIQSRLMRDRHWRGLTLPNYTPPNWFECDVFELTDAGFFREYEIKLTVSDFKADARKSQRRKGVDVFKRDLLGEPIQTKGPVQFWYVTPVGLLTPQMLPPWAGLIEISLRPPDLRYPQCFESKEHEVVKAPRLHNEKANERIRLAALVCCYWRLHSGVIPPLYGQPDHWDFSI